MYLGVVAQANQLKYCKECKCKDCEYKPKGDDCVSVVKGACGKPGTVRWALAGTHLIQLNYNEDVDFL